MSRSLQDAVASGNIGEVEVRINMGEDVNDSFPPRYLTCLHAAVLANNQEMLEVLVRRGAQLNQADRDGVTPLALAISLDKRALVNILSSAGGSTNPSVVPVLDIKHDPILSHPPPWAQPDKIYAVVKQKPNPPQNGFQVKKFDFKLFDKKEEKREERKVAENKYDIIKKFTKKTTTESAYDDQFSNRNVTGNSSKYIYSDVVTSPEAEMENIYDHVKNCDTIQVVSAETELENEPGVSQENPGPKAKTVSERLFDKSHQKGKQLKEKIMLTIFPKSRNTNEAKTETDDRQCRGENSLVRRFMRKCKSSRILQTTGERLSSVKINRAHNWKDFNSVRGRLSFKLKENKEDTKQTEDGGLVKNLIAKVNTSVKRSGKKENPKLTSLKNRLSNVSMVKKNNEDNLENNKLNILKSKISLTQEKIGNLKSKVPSLRREKTDEENKLKTTESDKSFKLSKFKLFDRVKSDNNPKKLLNSFNIKQKWSKVENSEEFSKTDREPKYSTVKSVREKKTRFSDEISEDFSKFSSLQSQKGSRGRKHTVYDSVSNGSDNSKYKWNYIDGQWKKCNSLGL